VREGDHVVSIRFAQLRSRVIRRSPRQHATVVEADEDHAGLAASTNGADSCAVKCAASYRHFGINGINTDFVAGRTGQQPVRCKEGESCYTARLVGVRVSALLSCVLRRPYFHREIIRRSAAGSYQAAVRRNRHAARCAGMTIFLPAAEYREHRFATFRQGR